MMLKIWPFENCDIIRRPTKVFFSQLWKFDVAEQRLLSDTSAVFFLNLHRNSNLRGETTLVNANVVGVHRTAWCYFVTPVFI